MEEESTDVIVQPAFDTLERVSTFFQNEGFGQYSGLRNFDNTILVSFNKMDQAKRFVRHFDGLTIPKGYKLSAYLKGEVNQPQYYREDSRSFYSQEHRDTHKHYDSYGKTEPRKYHNSSSYDRDYNPRDSFSSRDYPMESKSPPSPIKSRTIMISGYSKDNLSDRTLFNDFWRAGIIRHLECNIEELKGYIEFDTADEANDAIEMCSKRNDKLKAQIIKDRPLGLPKVLVPLVVLDDEGQEITEL